MKVEVTIFEFMDMLQKGSTNQKQFIQNIEDSGINVYTAIEVLEDELSALGLNEDPRGLINGGALHFGTTEDNENYIIPVNKEYGFILE